MPVTVHQKVEEKNRQNINIGSPINVLLVWESRWNSLEGMKSGNLEGVIDMDGFVKNRTFIVKNWVS